MQDDGYGAEYLAIPVEASYNTNSPGTSHRSEAVALSWGDDPPVYSLIRYRADTQVCPYRR